MVKGRAWILLLLYVIAGFFSAKYFGKALGSSSKGDAFSLFFILLLLASSRRAFWWLCFPAAILAALYYPISSAFGLPSYQFLSSLLATNASEAVEFLSLIPLELYGKSLIIPVGAYFTYRISSLLNIRPHKNKFFVLVCSLVIVFSHDPGGFGRSVGKAFSETEEEIQEIQALSDSAVAWNPVKLTADTDRYDDYVLVLGESARSDYMSLYGYPIQNTPFLDSVPGTFVDGLKSADGYTIGSLKLMLTRSHARQADFSRTFIELANLAGFETIWISNQGYTGVHDTPVTAIASKADQTLFVHKGEYSQGNFFDKMMLPVFENAVYNNQKKKT